VRGMCEARTRTPPHAAPRHADETPTKRRETSGAPSFDEGVSSNPPHHHHHHHHLPTTHFGAPHIPALPVPRARVWSQCGPGRMHCCSVTLQQHAHTP